MYKLAVPGHNLKVAENEFYKPGWNGIITYGA